MLHPGENRSQFIRGIEMRQNTSQSLGCVGWFALAVGAVFLGFLGIVWWGITTPDIVRTAHPVPRTEAEQRCPIPLPAGARNVEYAVWSHWISFIVLVRFEAPPEECVKHIDTILTWHDEKNPALTTLQKRRPRPPSYSGVPVTHVDRVDTSVLKPVPWFNPHLITRGIHAGVPGSHTPEVWVDLERGVFYYRETD